MTAFLSDSFNDTEGTLLENHDPDIGGAWEPLSFSTGTGSPGTDTVIRSNRLGTTGTVTSQGRFHRNAADPGADEYDIYVTMRFRNGAQSNRFHAVSWRVSPTGTSNSEVDRYVLFGRSSTTPQTWELFKIVSGSLTVMQVVEDTLADNAERFVKVEVRSGTTRILVNNVEIMSTTDTSITQRGRVGICPSRAGDGNHYMDDIYATPYVADPDPEDINASDALAVNFEDSASHDSIGDGLSASDEVSLSVEESAEIRKTTDWSEPVLETTMAIQHEPISASDDIAVGIEELSSSSELNPSLTTDFDGSELPAGWYVDSPLGGESVTVSNSCANIIMPSGTVYDSINSVSSPDNSPGIEFPIASGDLDIAVQCDTDVTRTYWLGWNVIIRSESNADACRFSFYKNNAGVAPQVYGYQRASGAGSSSGNNTITALNSGHYSWMRVTYVSSTGIWTCYGSVDGVNWVQLHQATRSFSPTRFKISGLSGSSTPGGTIKINKVVDVLAAGTTDLRDELPDRVRSTVFSFEGSDGALPSELSDDSANSGSISWTGDAMRLTQDRSINGSRARISYSGQEFEECGMLALVRHVSSSSNAYLVVGLGQDTGNPGDMYSKGPGYIHESNSGTTVRSLRVDEFDTVTGFEAPYTWLTSGSSALPFSNAHWIRVERIGRRVRIKDWLSGEEEPSAWRYDGQDQVLAGALGPALVYSHNDGATGTTATADVYSYEFYALISSEDTESHAVTDDAAVSVEESVTLVKEISVSDSISAGLEESSIMHKEIGLEDNISVSSMETGTIHSNPPGSDQLLVETSELASVVISGNLERAVSDSAGVSLSESANIVTTEFKNAFDGIVVEVSESSDNLSVDNELDTSSAIQVVVSISSQIAITIPTQQALAISAPTTASASVSVITSEIAVVTIAQQSRIELIMI